MQSRAVRLVIGAGLPVGVLALALVVYEFRDPFAVDNHLAAVDSRVCPGSTGNNLSFSDAMKHFDLVLPANATHVAFTANVNPLRGDHDLSLRFRTTPSGLDAFLMVAGLVRRSGVPTTSISVCEQAPSGGTVQGLDDPTNGAKGVVYNAEVDLTDPNQPQVWINAFDM